MLQSKLFLVGRRDDHQDAAGPAAHDISRNTPSIQQFDFRNDRLRGFAATRSHISAHSTDLYDQVKFLYAVGWNQYHQDKLLLL